MRPRYAALLRSLALFTAGALALTACGGTTDDTETSATTAGSSTDTGRTTADTDEPQEPSDDPAAETEQPDEITVTHAQGETVVPVEPQTVVTFDLGVLDTLDALGVEVAGVPEAANLPERLAQYAGDGYTKVGTLFEPDYEVVNSLEPDLIIVGGRSSEVYGDLERIAPTIDLTVDNADFVEDLVRHLETLGQIFAAEDRVDDEVATLRSRIDEVAAQAADAGTGLVLLTTGGEVAAYGPGSRFGIIHDELGVAPAAPDVEDATHGDAVSFELILEADPDHLFVLDRDAAIGESGEAAAAVLDNEIVAQTTAWQQDQVTYLDGNDWYLMPTGLRSLSNMIDAIETAVS